MNVIDEGTDLTCARHPKVETRVRCGKCGAPICPRCMVQTPVGARCGACARLRRLPQYDVRPAVLARSLAVGLGASLVGWYIASYVPYLRFILGAVIGAAVGEAMSRASARRTSIMLEIAAVMAVVAGLVGVGVVERALGIATPWTFGTGGAPALSAYAVLPAVVAAIVAVVKLR